MSNVLEVDDIGQLRDLIAATPNLVIKYWATWCGPCKMYAPTFEQASLRVLHATFVSVDIDKVPEASVEYGVMGVPATHQYKDGEQVNALVGAQRLVPLVQTLTA